MSSTVIIFLGIIVAAAGAAHDDHDRRLGAILGAALGDAAAMPLHWIYNTSAIQEKLLKGAKRIDAAFFSPPSCPFYVYPEGENSPYGQQTRLILQTLATTGSLKPTLIQDRYWSYYGASSGACHERQNSTSKSGCYWDGSTKGFVANYKAGLRYPKVGANDTQANAIVHMVPIVAVLAGSKDTEMLQEVETLIHVTQNTDKAAAFGLAGARILSKVIEGKSLLAAVQETAKALRQPERQLARSEDVVLANGLDSALSQLDRPSFDFVQEVGQSCDYPLNLWSGSHLVAQLSPIAHENSTLAYLLGMRQNIEAGGDSASRGAFVGALLGAVTGESGLPAEWKKKYLHYDKVLADARTWLSANPSARAVLV